jgi:hypothetical protein
VKKSGDNCFISELRTWVTLSGGDIKKCDTVNVPSKKWNYQEWTIQRHKATLDTRHRTKTNKTKETPQKTKKN